MSKEVISKELLSLVLGRKVDAIRTVGDNIIYFITIDEDELEYDGQLNIDTLGRLIKEKLKIMGYVINIYHHHDTVATSITKDGGLTRYSSPSMSVFTELESLVDALDYANKNKEK